MAGVGAGAWLAHPLGSLGGYAYDGAGQAGSATPSASPVSAPTSQPSEKASLTAPSQSPATTPPEASTPMTPRQMLRTLRSLLPAGAVLTDDPTAANAPGSLEVNYNDGHGKADIMIDVTPFDKVMTDQQVQASGPPRRRRQ